MGKWCLHASSFIFYQIVIKVAGNQDRHKSSDEFDFGPLVSMAHLYVFWNEIWLWHIGLRWAIVALWATCSSHFSQELWGLEDWNLVHTWTVGRCIVYTGIRLLLHIRPFIFSFFFLSNFQTLKFFVTLFSGTVRPRRLKLGTHMDNGQTYSVYQNQAASAYLSLYFFIFLCLQFSNIEIFCHTFLRNCEA